MHHQRRVGRSAAPSLQGQYWHGEYNYSILWDQSRPSLPVTVPIRCQQHPGPSDFLAGNDGIPPPTRSLPGAAAPSVVPGSPTVAQFHLPVPPRGAVHQAAPLPLKWHLLVHCDVSSWFPLMPAAAVQSLSFFLAVAQPVTCAPVPAPGG